LIFRLIPGHVPGPIDCDRGEDDALENIEADKSTKEGNEDEIIATRVRRTRSNLRQLLEEEMGGIVKALGGPSRESWEQGSCLKTRCEKRERYILILEEAVQILSKTKGNFHSRKLGALRKILIQEIRQIKRLEGNGTLIRTHPFSEVGHRLRKSG